MPITRTRLTAGALAITAVALAFWFRGTVWRSPQTSNAAASGTTVPTGTSSSGWSRDPVTLEALGRFRQDIKSASSGQWTILETPALAASDRGEWDDFRVGSPVVMKDSGASPYRMWFIGCRLAADQHDCGVGHATSRDGLEWTRSDSPVFVPPDLPAVHWLGALAIVKREDGYAMWYSLDGDRFAGRPLGTLHLATSTDGLVWQNVGLVHTAVERRTIRHAVHHDGQRLHLWYADANDDGAESFLHFTSSDGRTWTPAGSDTLDGNAARVGRPWVIADGRGEFRALLVDAGGMPEVRWVVSTDGTTWRPGPVEMKARTAAGESIVDASGLQEPGGLWLWTTVVLPGRLDENISVAFRTGSGS